MTNKEDQCPQYKRCNGCQLQNMTYDQQLRWKEIKVERLLYSFGKINKIKAMDNPTHYRNKVQAVFRTTVGGKIISGVYQSATNGIVAVESCMLNNKRGDRIVVAVRTVMKRLGITTYNPKTDKGFVKHVLVRTAANTGEIMVVLVTATEKFNQSKHFVKELLSLYPKITTIVQNVNDNPFKLMLGGKERILYGNGYIFDNLCGCKFKISPGSFYQINSVQTEYLYNKAVEMAKINSDTTVLDAYCGTGTIGLIAAKHAKNVVGIEISGSAIKDAKENAKLNNRKNAFFYKGDAGKFLEEWQSDDEKPQVVFMDPPRAGSNRAFLNALVAAAPQRIVYISCNPETQQRDLMFLTEHGGYQVTEIQPVDMFPYTNHVETVVLMSRVEK
ncbi:MAG TPA: 23S rRNA (uracil(1939)-C(5))-methyltransferase RlmD [Clostridiales bacterium]|nr:23S rRNA (uracil(1939)-C(5))-methyltransferase RlmD [Clostridiales bacterium]